MLSDLIEEHGPLAATAMSSPTHTTTFVLPAQQTSPAQLAGLAPDSHLDSLSDGGGGYGLQQQQLQLSDPAAQQLAWTMTDASVAAGIAAGDLMTFKVDGQIKLGLRPRQLTFSGSAQQAQQQQLQPPQLGPQLHGSNQALPAAELAPANVASLPAAAEMFPDAGRSELSPVPLLPSRAASNASNAFADIAASDAAVQHDAVSAPAMALQSGQTPNGPRPQASLMPADPVSVVMTQAVYSELQTGQQLTEVAPSLSWPAAAPSRHSSGLPLPLSQQQSNAPPPLAQQSSAVVRGPVRQTSAVATAAAPSRQNSSTLSDSQQQQPLPLPLSRQASRSQPSASRQGSGLQLPLSRQASAAATNAARQSAEAEEPEQAAGSGPRQGLEQAWAALLPSLLAGALKQQSGEAAMHPSALLPAVLQQPGRSDAEQQSVGDILKTWAPIARPMAAGEQGDRHEG